MWSHGVMVSTQDSESCNPSSNLGGTSFLVYQQFRFFDLICLYCLRNYSEFWTFQKIKEVIRFISYRSESIHFILYSI